MSVEIEPIALKLAVLENSMNERLKSIDEKLSQLLAGESVSCIKHEDRIHSLEQTLKQLAEDQRWLRRQMIAALIGLVTAGALALSSTMLKHFMQRVHI